MWNKACKSQNGSYPKLLIVWNKVYKLQNITAFCDKINVSKY